MSGGRASVGLLSPCSPAEASLTGHSAPPLALYRRLHTGAVTGVCGVPGWAGWGPGEVSTQRNRGGRVARAGLKLQGNADQMNLGTGRFHRTVCQMFAVWGQCVAPLILPGLSRPPKPPSPPCSKPGLGLGRVIDPRDLRAGSWCVAGVGLESLQPLPPPHSSAPWIQGTSSICSSTSWERQQRQVLVSP